MATPAENTYSLPDISARLAEIFSTMESEDSGLIKSANQNLIILCADSDSKERMDSLIDAFAGVHPSRFFALRGDTKISVDISARCHPIGGGSGVCSELIRISYPNEWIARLPSIIRANLIPGKLTELYVSDPTTMPALLQTIAPLAERIYFDSQDFTKGLRTIEDIRRQSNVLVDFEWMRLSAWRDQIKDIFERPTLNREIPKLTAVQIQYEAGNSERVSTGAYLLAGWVVRRLGGEPKSYGKNGYECLRGSLAPFYLTLDVKKNSGSDTLRRVIGISMTFGTSGSIKIERKAALETTVTYGGGMHISKPVDDESELGIIRRYFLVGESTANFDSSLLAALELRRLRHGFEDS